MPTLRAGSNPPHLTSERAACLARGFTLVELMIVITIIALMSAAVVLLFPDPRGKLRDEAERFAARTRAAHDMAILEGRSVSVWVSAAGYGFDRREGNTWAPISDKPLRVERWSDGVRPMIESRSGRDRVIFDSTGFASAPLAVRLDRGDDRSVRVAIGTNGAVAIDG